MRHAALVCALVLLLGAQAGDKARISDFQVSIEGDSIRANFALENSFGPELLERIRTGLPTGFDLKFKLVRPRRRWFDNDIAKTTFQAVAMYNAVTREYLVNYKLNGKLIESRVLLDEDELHAAMTRFEQLEVFDVASIRGNRIYVRARAALGSKSLFFLIPTTVKTDWVESQRFRLPGELE